MSARRPNPGRIAGIVVLAGFLGVLLWGFARPPQRPASRRILAAEKEIEAIVRNEGHRDDARLVRQLLAENLGERRFSFATVVLAVADRKVLPLDPREESHRRVLAAIDGALRGIIPEMNGSGSPARGLRRINEASRIFEDMLLQRIGALPGFRCEVPATREGGHQRSGYPDLKITDEASGDVFYLDPKLFEESSRGSTLRTFYFEPKDRTLKIDGDAVHLLAGISHDGEDGGWTFGRWEIVDLSKLEVRLKAEFQASNADLYPP